MFDAAAQPPSAVSVSAARPAPDRSVRALFAQLYLAFGLQHGISPEDLCAAAGITPADVAERDRHVPYVWARGLLDALRERLPGLCLGLELGKFAGIEAQGYLGQAVSTSPTGLDALRLFVQCIQLQDTAYRHGSEVVVLCDRVELRVPTLHADQPQAIEMGFVNVAWVARQAFAALRVVEVRFAHAGEAASQQRFADFFGCPVHFASDADVLALDRAALELPNPKANPEAYAHISAYLAEQVEAQAESIVTVVARVIASRLGRGALSQASVAKQLCLGERSLQRQLKQHGTTFRDVFASARREEATRLLRQPDITIYQVAAAVGYDDASAFNKAFRRWLGMSPRSYRQRALHA